MITAVRQVGDLNPAAKCLRILLCLPAAGLLLTGRHVARVFCRVPTTGVKDVLDGSAILPMLAFACPSWLATRTAEGLDMPALTVPSSLHGGRLSRRACMSCNHMWFAV